MDFTVTGVYFQTTLYYTLELYRLFARNFQAQKTPHIDNDLGYYQLIALKHSVVNLYQRISCIPLGKEKIESNFTNINGDLNF